MSRSSLVSLVVLGALAGTITIDALAFDKQTKALLSSGIKDPLGMPAPDSSATRSITLSANTKYVDVERREVVRFVVNGKSFVWQFDTLGTPAFELAAIAPKGIDIGKVIVYVQDYRDGLPPGESRSG